jgi:hydrogenase nickel incorporation protein HypA/HybF
MHELSITSNIVELVAGAAVDRRVRRVTIEIGQLSGVMTEAVAFCFDEVARGTVVEGATLEIREIEGRSRCLECGTEFASVAFYTPCPCGSLSLERLQGEELNIKSMELEAA